MADNYGTPAPLTILVIQIDPLPIPHLIPSAPASINFNAPGPLFPIREQFQNRNASFLGFDRS